MGDAYGRGKGRPTGRQMGGEVVVMGSGKMGGGRNGLKWTA